jgi:hypothetical protein
VLTCHDGTSEREMQDKVRLSLAAVAAKDGCLYKPETRWDSDDNNTGTCEARKYPGSSDELRTATRNRP